MMATHVQAEYPLPGPSLKHGMDGMGTDGLWTKRELENAIERDTLADWKTTRYITFHETMRWCRIGM